MKNLFKKKYSLARWKKEKVSDDFARECYLLIEKQM